MRLVLTFSCLFHVVHVTDQLKAASSFFYMFFALKRVDNIGKISFHELIFVKLSSRVSVGINVNIVIIVLESWKTVNQNAFVVI